MIKKHIKKDTMYYKIFKIMSLLLCVINTNAQIKTCSKSLIKFERFNNISKQSVKDREFVYDLAKLILNQESSISSKEALYQAYLLNPEISLRAAERLALAIFTHVGKDNIVDNIIDSIINQLDCNSLEILNRIVKNEINGLKDKNDIYERIAYLKSKVLCEFKKSYHEVDTKQSANWTNTYKGLNIDQQKYCVEKYLTKAVNFMIDYPNFTVRALENYKKI